MKTKPAWWLWSLALHLVVFGALYWFFAYSRAPSPGARPVRQPVVAERVLDTATRQIQDKQAEEMARKLRELASLTGAIQAAETRHRGSYASFEAAATRLGPELVAGLAADTRRLYEEFRPTLDAERAAWEAFAARDREAHEKFDAASPPERREILDRLKPLVRTIREPQARLNLAQAGLLDAERQIAGRLGFLRDQAPGLVAAQGEIVKAWIRTMELGGAYLESLGPLDSLHGSGETLARRAADRARELGREQESRERIVARMAEREAAITEIGAAREELSATLSTLDPADRRQVGDTQRKIGDLQRRLERTQRDLANDHNALARQDANIQTRAEALAAAAGALADELARIHEARRAILEARARYTESLEQTLALRGRIEATLLATLESIAAETPSATQEPAR